MCGGIKLALGRVRPKKMIGQRIMHAPDRVPNGSRGYRSEGLPSDAAPDHFRFNLRRGRPTTGPPFSSTLEDGEGLIEVAFTCTAKRSKSRSKCGPPPVRGTIEIGSDPWAALSPCPRARRVVRPLTPTRPGRDEIGCKEVRGLQAGSLDDLRRRTPSLSKVQRHTRQRSALSSLLRLPAPKADIHPPPSAALRAAI